ncbi:MAG: aryl-sulfate sulfotransferase [Streptococcaceae bacterium]|nr:aryl-sulfate sulfotransferase [Streptococcaceae bacterium]
MKKRTRFISAGIILGIILAVAGILFLQRQSATPEKNPTTLLSSTEISDNLGTELVTTRQDDQATSTADYATTAQDQSYSLESPYIKVNPYEISPLSALIIFTTPQAASISYTVLGKTEGTSLTNTVNGGAQTVHQIPVVGLYADYDNTVKITVTYADGTTAEKSFTVTTSKLPKYISSVDISVTNVDKSKMDIGDNELTIINRTTKEPFAVDADGEVRWYLTEYSQHTIEQWSNGHLMILSKEDVNSLVYNDLIEVDVLGRVYKEFTFSSKTSATDGGEETTVIHHDLLELPNGNILATVSDGSVYKEDTLAEISYETGKVVKVVDMKTIFPESMYVSYQKGDDEKVDWLHTNSLDYDNADGTILISNRNQDLTMKFNWASDEIVWLYSGKEKSEWPDNLQQYVLTPTEGSSITGGQHALTLLEDEDNNPNSEDVLLFDNNINVTNGDASTSGKYSQAVQYHIDLDKMTIDQTWAWGKKLGKKNYSMIIGYAQRLSNDNTLIDFGFLSNGENSNIIEVDADGNQVFNLVVENAASKAYAYRAYREAFYSSDYVFDALNE